MRLLTLSLLLLSLCAGCRTPRASYPSGGWESRMRAEDRRVRTRERNMRTVARNLGHE